MLSTPLPNRKLWAQQLEALRRHYRVTITDIAERADLSRLNVSRALKGERGWDNLKEVENRLIEIVNEKNTEDAGQDDSELISTRE